MQKEFTKADLKDGMIVEYRKGYRRLVINGYLIGKDSNYKLDNYHSDLKCSYSDLDIMKVFKVRRIVILNELFDTENLELIWERDETKRMTTEEMRHKLEELTGETIEIEPSREEMVGICYGFCGNYPEMLCNGCPLREVENCNFEELTNEELKECYEKVIEHGK